MDTELRKGMNSRDSSSTALVTGLGSENPIPGQTALPLPFTQPGAHTGRILASQRFRKKEGKDLIRISDFLKCCPPL